MNNKCVYVHKLNGEVVYVGSGAIERAKGKADRSEEHLSVWPLLEFEILISNITQSEAKTIEMNTIDLYWDSGKLLNRKRNTDRVKKLDYNYLSEWLYYDETSPSCLRWKKKTSPSSRMNIGNVAGTLGTLGYYTVTINKKLYSGHRVVWVLNSKTDIPEGFVVDHKNRQGSDNRVDNLRIVSVSENNKNRVIPKSNTGFSNISHADKDKCFIVYFTNHGIKKSTRFTYNCTKKSKVPERCFKSREEAFEAALRYRNTIVEQGLIIITSKEELNGIN